MANWFVIIQLMACIYEALALGVTSGMTGPFLPYLMFRLKCNYQDITTAMIFGSVGGMIGSFVGGYITTRYKGLFHLTIAVGGLLRAADIIITPHCTSVVMLAIVQLLSNLGGTHACSGATQHILMNGGRYTDPLIHVFHAFFGIGSFLGAQIAGPFLQVKYINRTSGLRQIAKNTSTPLSTLSMHVHNDSIGEDVSANITLVKVYDAPIEIPALIGGLVALGVPIFFSIFQIAQWMSKDSGESGQTVEKATVPKKTSIQDAMDPTTCTGRGRCFGLTMLVLLFIMYFNHTGGEHLLWKFIFSFAMESKNLGFSVDEAIWLSSAFAIAFTCGRLTTGLCAKFMIPEIMWAILLCLNVLAGIILSIWGNDFKMVAWVCIVSYGALVGPLFPTGQAWANRYLHLSTLATALFYISANLGYLTYSRVTGYLFDVYGVATMPWMCLTFAGLCLVNLLIMQIIATRHGLKKPKTTAEKNTPHEERLMETTT